MQIELTFEFERETKNTIRFQEIEDNDGNVAVGTLYVQKAALGKDVPDVLHVTISTAAVKAVKGRKAS